ncbi:hypothetical protein [Fundidesulfovibrio butyratiphilus]
MYHNAHAFDLSGLYAQANNQAGVDELEILDVGSGLAVFAAELARRGYGCHYLDPSPLSAEHALRRAGARSARAGSIADWPTDHPWTSSPGTRCSNT